MSHFPYFVAQVIPGRIGRRTRPSILCVTQKRAFMPLYIVLGQQRACMPVYDSIATVGEIRVYRRAHFQSGSRVLKKVF